MDVDRIDITRTTMCGARGKRPGPFFFYSSLYRSRFAAVPVNMATIAPPLGAVMADEREKKRNPIISVPVILSYR